MARHPDLVDEFLKSPDPRIRLDCWKVLVEYQFGKPVQPLVVDLDAEASKWAERSGLSPEQILTKAKALVDGVLN